MARWKLVNPHYINTINGTEWEYQETDQKTRRQVRRKFPVPRLLDPSDPSDWTNKWGFSDNQEGEIIVCHPSKGDSSDIEFTGDPTPDMIPVDDEAKAVSASFAKHWSYKPDSVTAGDYSQSLINKFEHQMDALRTKPAEIPGMADLIAAIAAQTKQQGELLAALAGSAPSLRRP